MRPCPSCGSLSRVKLAPSLFECTADKEPEPGTTSENAETCGTQYLDTSETRQDSAVTSLGQILARLIGGD